MLGGGGRRLQHKHDCPLTCSVVAVRKKQPGQQAAHERVAAAGHVHNVVPVLPERGHPARPLGGQRERAVLARTHHNRRHRARRRDEVAVEHARARLDVGGVVWLVEDGLQLEVVGAGSVGLGSVAKDTRGKHTPACSPKDSKPPCQCDVRAQWVRLARLRWVSTRAAGEHGSSLTLNNGSHASLPVHPWRRNLSASSRMGPARPASHTTCIHSDSGGVVANGLGGAR